MESQYKELHQAILWCSNQGRWDVAYGEEMKNSYKIIREAERKRPLGRPWHGWEGHFKEMDCEGVVWM